MKAKKKKLKILNDIHKLHQNLIGLLKHDLKRPTQSYRVSFEASDSNDLLLKIASLLEVCMFALDENGILLSPADRSVAKQDSVGRVLELVLNILPDSQMYFMDKVTEKMTKLENEVINSSK